MNRRNWLLRSPRFGKLAASFVAVVAVVTGLAVIGSASPASGVHVHNDLDYEVAVNPRCWTRSVSGADPEFIGPGESQRIDTAGPCIIHGPTSRFGPLGAIRGEGPYLGCLAIHNAARASDLIVRVSELDSHVSFSDCDDATAP
jgi:hypothetical protein